MKMKKIIEKKSGSLKNGNRISQLNEDDRHDIVSHFIANSSNGLGKNPAQKLDNRSHIKTSSKGRILIVDDDINTRKSLTLIFNNFGFSIDTVATGNKALEAVKNKAYDLIILDVRLPDIDGISLLKSLKEIDAQISVLIITAYASTTSAINALNQGAAAYIMKPLDIDELIIKVNDILEKKRLILENRQLYKIALQEINKQQQKEKELQENIKKYEELANLLPQTIYECDITGRLTYTNHDSYKIFGYTKYDYNNNMNVTELIAPEDRDRAIQNLKGVLEGKKTYGNEYMAIRKNGSRFPVIVFSSPVVSENEIVGSRGVLVDISAQKLAEEKAKNSVEQLQNLMETAPVVICQLDSAQKIQYVNNEFIKTSGYTRKQVINKRWTELDLVSQDIVKSLPFQLEDNTLAKAIEIEVKRKDGNLIWLTVRAEKIKNRLEVIGYQVIAHNITERKTAEKKLEESNERFNILFNHMQDAVMLYEENPNNTPGKFIEVNEAACKMLQYSKEELRELTPIDLLKDKSNMMPDSMESLEKFIKERNLVPERTLITKNGTEIIIDAISHVIYHRGKTLVITLARDIGQRRKTEEELQRSYRSLKRAMDGTIKTVASLVELRDPYTAGHQARVSKLACAIAEEMGYKCEHIEAINAAGLVHDIGKISIPSEILSKPGKLNKIEFQMIKAHPLVGYEILKDIEFPWPIAMYILQHHERLDGSGYPSGLSGNDICMEARILSVADVVEAMATHRPYRPALGIDAALEEITKNKGILYDPQVVDACVQVFNIQGFQL